MKCQFIKHRIPIKSEILVKTAYFHMYAAISFVQMTGDGSTITIQ